MFSVVGLFVFMMLFGTPTWREPKSTEVVICGLAPVLKGRPLPHLLPPKLATTRSSTKRLKKADR